MAWYRSVTSPELFLSNPFYLQDPRQQQYEPEEDQPFEQHQEHQQYTPQQPDLNQQYTSQHTHDHQHYDHQHTQQPSTFHHINFNPSQLNYHHFASTQPLSQPPYHPNTQPQIQTQTQPPRRPRRRPSNPTEPSSSTAQLSPDMGPDEESNPPNFNVASASHHRSPYGYQTPTDQFAFYRGSTGAADYYRPQMEPTQPPPPQFQTFEGMGNRLYDSQYQGRYGGIDDFIDSDPTHNTVLGPSTQAPQEPQVRRPRVRRPPRCGTGGHL